MAPRPYDKNQGWIKIEEEIEPVWSLGPIITLSLVDILSQKEEDDANADATDDREILGNEELDEIDNIDSDSDIDYGIYLLRLLHSNVFG